MLSLINLIYLGKVILLLRPDLDIIYLELAKLQFLIRDFKNSEETLIEMRKAMSRLFTKYSTTNPRVYERISYIKETHKLVVIHVCI